LKKKEIILIKHSILFSRYWHRSLNPKKLIDVGFSHIGRNMTLARTLRLYRLDDQPKTPGFRKMILADCPYAFKILKEVGNFDF
jgi:glycylpeptide N-tetradecanoyltransferase